MDPTPRKPCRKKKRLAAEATVLALVVAYPASLGPAIFAVRERWVAGWAIVPFRPALELQLAPIVGEPYKRYLGWWFHLSEPSL